MKEARRRSSRVSIRRICALCLALGFALFCLPPLKAQANKDRVIKVGAFFYAGFLEAGGDGSYIDYIFDYLREISQHTGWRYEFVNAGWKDCLAMLEKGEIDLLGPAAKTWEREEKFAFPDSAMGCGYGALITRLDNKTLPDEDFEAFDGLRVGVLKDSRRTENFIQYSQKNRFSSQLVYYDEQTEIKRDLDAGILDAATMSSMFSFSGLRVVARFGMEDFFFITGKENREVLAGLNYAMEQIRLANPYFNSDLNKRYSQLQESAPISFTREEIDYIEQSGPIRCAYNPVARPISYYDKDTGRFRGIAADLWKLLAEKTGLQFQFVHSQTYLDALDLFTSQKVELLAGLDPASGWAQKNNAFLSKSYLESQIMMVTAGKVSEKPVIALYDRDQQSAIPAVVRTAERAVYYPSAEECLNAVQSGRADITFVNSTIMDYHAGNSQYVDLQTARLSGAPIHTRIAVAGNQEPALVSILNKALDSISDTQMEQIVSANMRMDLFGSLKNILRVRPLDFMLVFAGALLVITFILMALFHNRAKSAEDMRRMLYTDALTGYANYKALCEAAPKLLGNDPGRYALAYLDMHQFKYINDTLGYAAGDEILSAISDTLNAFVEEDERFARVYADRFVLLLKSGEQEAFLCRLNDLSGRLERLSTGEFSVANFVFSCGVYRLGEEACDIDMACDRANYAKDTSQNSFATSFVFYDELMRRQIMDEKWLESSMQPALERGEFIPYYQPKVNVVTGAVVGAEAVVRWNHPERGILLPADFIPFLEKNGFVVHIDFAVFTEVCRCIREWIDAGKTPVPVSVNFSRRHIMEPDFADRLKAVADRFAVSCRLLEIEITETVAMDDLDIAADFVQSLKRHGFLISIDDYGTGYSSIAFLQKLPLDVLKLDKSFVDNAMQCKKARDIMRHLVTAMRDNRIRVLCEGIETQEQRNFIISQNCCFAQGYLYCGPVPRKEFEAYLGKAGISVHEYVDYIPACNFEEYLRLRAGDFIDRAMPGWILGCYADEGYPIFYISPQMLSRLGYSEFGFFHETGGLFANWLHPDDLRRITKEIDQCNGRLEECPLQYRVRKRNGEYLWIRDVGKKICTEDGREAILCVCTDITDMVALRQEKDDLISALPGGMCELMYAPDGPAILAATKGFYTLIGRSREEMEALNNKLFSIVYAADLPDAKKTLRYTMRAGHGTCRCAFRIFHKDGGVHWLSLVGAIRERDRRQIIISTVHNIDEEMQARQDVELVKAKLELALTLTDLSIFEYDIRTKAIYEQSGLQELFPPGVSMKNVPDSLIQSGFIHPEDVPAFQEKYRRIAEGEPHASCEVRMRSRSAKAPDAPLYVWMRTTFSTIYDEAGRAVKAVGIVENIDREKRIEHAFAQGEQYREALTASSILAYDVNLTRDTISRVSGTGAERALQICDVPDDPQSYSALIRTAAQTLIAREDRTRFLRDMCLEHLRKLHREGINEQEYEYRRLLPDGSKAWIAAFLHLMPDKWSGDLFCVIHYRDIQTRKSMEESLQYRATRDALTGLLNRASGERRIQEFLSGAGSKRGIHAFLMIDMDHFKKVNDTYGHQYGDKFLINVAKSVSESLQSSDIVARMGGDEFVALIKDLREEKEAMDAAQKVALAITACGRDMNIPFKTVVSIGVALAPRDGMDFDTLYRRADEAMYAAKKKGDIRIVMVGGEQKVWQDPPRT